MENKYISNVNKTIYIISTICQKIFILLLPLCIQKLIDAVMEENYNVVLAKGIQCVIVTVVLILCMSISNYSAVSYEEGMIISLRKKILKSISAMKYSDFKMNGSGYYFQRFQGDVSGCRSFFIRKRVNIWLNAIYAVTIIILMFRIHIKYAVSMLIPFPVLIIAYMVLASKIEKYTDLSESKQDSINSYFNETINCGYTLRLRNASKWQLDRADHAFAERFLLQNKINGIETFYDMFLITGILNLLTTSVYLIGGLLAFHNEISIGMVMAMSLYFSKLWSPLEFFLDYPAEYAEYKIHKKRIDEILSSIGYESITGKEEPFNIINIKNVTIHYGNAKILQNINLEFAKGEKIWIKGDNGCGKTSLANLITGIIDSYSGDMFYNGRNYNEWNMELLRNHICMIGDTPELFNTTIEDNILLGLNRKIPNNMRKVIEEMGLNLGDSVSERGSNLSGGQAKIIQFLQGIIEDADLYIIDEPLNFIDDKHAQILLDLMDAYLKEKTVIIISHDERVKKFCDRVVRLENQKLVEEAN